MPQNHNSSGVHASCGIHILCKSIIDALARQALKNYSLQRHIFTTDDLGIDGHVTKISWLSLQLFPSPNFSAPLGDFVVKQDAWDRVAIAMDVMDDRQARLSHIRAFILWNTDQSLSLNLFLSLSFSLVPSLCTELCRSIFPECELCVETRMSFWSQLCYGGLGLFPRGNINIRTGKSKLMKSPWSEIQNQYFKLPQGHRSLARTSPSAMGRGWDMGMDGSVNNS